MRVRFPFSSRVLLPCLVLGATLVPAAWAQPPAGGEGERAAQGRERAPGRGAQEEGDRASSGEGSPQLRGVPVARGPEGGGEPGPGADADEAREARRYGPVERGETLLGIARRTRPEGVSLTRMMVALLLANPGAFAEPGNPDSLMAGATLAVPPREAIASMGDAMRRALEEGARAQARGQPGPERPASAARPRAPARGGDGAGGVQAQFEASLRELLPLSPEQVKRYRRRLDETQAALRAEPRPKLRSRSAAVRLSPGEAPPVVRVAPGYVTALAFYDATGAPWPLTSATVGNERWFSVLRPEDVRPGNTLTVTALAQHVASTMVVTFEGAGSPVPVELRAADAPVGREGRWETDAMVAFRLAGRGPRASEPTVAPEVEPTLGRAVLAFLDGVPPAGAERLALEPEVPGLSVWRYRGRLYVRTQDTALWPAWETLSRGVDDQRVYRMPDVPSIVLSRAGRRVHVALGELPSAEPPGGGQAVRVRPKEEESGDG